MRQWLSYVLWPGLVAGCVGITAWGIQTGQGPLVFNLTYVALGLSLFVLERWMPYEPAWLKNDGQMLADLLHTVVSKGFVYMVVMFAMSVDLATQLGSNNGIWPQHWPLWAQVVLGLVVAEFGFYWAHRIFHEFKPVWRFHAIHHSVERLWFWNTGRFHMVDTLRSMAFGLPLLFLAGAPQVVFTYVSSITAFIGLLTHCNVDMRTGWLNYVFNTPRLHRWHHSKDIREGDKNYGENLVLWDLIFGSFYNASYRPPVNIGIKEFMPRSYWGQLTAPFVWKKLQQGWVPLASASAGADLDFAQRQLQVASASEDKREPGQMA